MSTGGTSPVQGSPPPPLTPGGITRASTSTGDTKSVGEKKIMAGPQAAPSMIGEKNPSVEILKSLYPNPVKFKGQDYVQDDFTFKGNSYVIKVTKEGRLLQNASRDELLVPFEGESTFNGKAISDDKNPIPLEFINVINHLNSKRSAGFWPRFPGFSVGQLEGTITRALSSFWSMIKSLFRETPPSSSPVSDSRPVEDGDLTVKRLKGLYPKPIRHRGQHYVKQDVEGHKNFTITLTKEGRLLQYKGSDSEKTKEGLFVPFQGEPTFYGRPINEGNPVNEDFEKVVRFLYLKKEMETDLVKKLR